MEPTIDECIALLEQEASEVRASILKQQEYLHQVNDELAGYMREKTELLKSVVINNPHVDPRNWSANLQLLAHHRLGIEYGASRDAFRLQSRCRGAIIAVLDEANRRGEPVKSRLLAIATKMETELMDVLQVQEIKAFVDDRGRTVRFRRYPSMGLSREIYSLETGLWYHEAWVE